MNVITQFKAAYEYEHDVPFRTVFEGAAIGIGICRLDGQILEANAALSRMLGYSPQELLRTRADELYPDLHCDAERELYAGTLSLDQRLLGELMRGERDSFETEKHYRRKDGSHLWGHLTVSVGRDGRRHPAFLIATLADATERKQVEEHLREAEKMEVIGRLAGGIAHDFNNLLTGILLYCDLLSAGLESTEMRSLEVQRSANSPAEPCELCQHVEEVRRAGEQGAAMTQQLLAIARKQAAEPRPVLINEIAASTENLLRRLIGEQIELVLTLDRAFDPTVDPAAGLVLADPAQLRQVLMNLVLNARDAMPQGGRITISTRATEFPHEVDEVPRSAEPGICRRAISLAVTDNGCGMDAETRARLFEPFFTTKKPGEGTGLGLATVQRIVSESGGMIAVESRAGWGTRIEVFLPAIKPSSKVSSNKVSSNEVATIAELATKSSNHANQPVSRPDEAEFLFEIARKTILLVDDNAPARKSMQRILVDAGYRILAASSGNQALEMLAEHSETPDLLIADCMMPSMNGENLAEMLLRKKPALKVLLISGYENPPVGSAAGAVEMIHKPFSGRALIDRVVDVLHREASRS